MDHNATTTCWWSTLRAVTAKQWLRRYAEFCDLYVKRTTNDNESRRVSFDLFRKEIRWLSRFHMAVLHHCGRGEATTAGGRMVTIPIPRGGSSSRVVRSNNTTLHSDEEGGTHLVFSSSGSSQSSIATGGETTSSSSSSANEHFFRSETSQLRTTFCLVCFLQKKHHAHRG